MVQSLQPHAELEHDRLAESIEVDDEVEEEKHELDSVPQATGDTEIADEDEDEDDSMQEPLILVFMTSSVSQLAVHTVYENGRRYCNDSYFMPNDDAEQTRLNIIHQAFLLLLDGELTKAPIPRGRPCRILDIGTGPGDWAVEMGEMYPDAQVIATDISVFDAGPAVLGLPNVHFQLDDAEAAEWTYNEPFELIHFRGLAGAFRNWAVVYQQAFKNLTAGGYIEVVESEPDMDAIVFPDLHPDSYYNILASAMQSTVLTTSIITTESNGVRAHLQPSLLTASGFVDVRTYDISVPLGTWPTDPRQSTLGKMMLIAFLEGLEARCLRPLTATGRWTASSVRDICEKVKLEVAASRGATVSVRFVTGRKPMSHAPRRWRYQRRIEELLGEMDLSSGPSGT
ncbi:hypothetical protein PISL3812_05603 [Talaromyces islandicus]|uniref:S-adenosyl-L-methionine-dependent methyltransferase n=1 Tax=Talaromyces islandicus TaxID=28573 RepID=A0A0U1LZJ7_TALIS|nr:hypothetical protein PISL3812_05603 [Talaromyces islandicus]